MKKFLCLLSVCLLSLLSFAGCGVKGASFAAGIQFIKDVFYVDYNIDTFLDYKIYPTTASDVYVNYDIENDVSIDSFFSFSKGSVKILNERFTSIKVTAMVNEFSDVCEVRLKKYPSSVFFDKEEDYINAGSIYPLNLQGLFGEDVLSCKDKQYVFKVTSSNPSVIEIESEKDLLLRSTGRLGEVKIDVQICDSLNQEKIGLKASIKLIVVDNIKEAFVTIGSTKLKNDEIINLKSSDFGIGNSLNLKVQYINENNFINEVSDCLIYLTNDNVCEIVDDEYNKNSFYLKVKDLEPLNEGEYYSTCLIMQSTSVKKNGEPLLLRFNIRIFV